MLKTSSWQTFTTTGLPAALPSKPGLLKAACQSSTDWLSQKTSPSNGRFLPGAKEPSRRRASTALAPMIFTRTYATSTLPVANDHQDPAYQLTKTYWQTKATMGQAAAWWNGVNKGLMANITGRKIHPGAQRYYRSAAQ